MAFIITPNVRVSRDNGGIAHHIVHMQEPYTPAGAGAATPRSLASQYMQDVASVYGVDPQSLSTLSDPSHMT